MLGFVLREILQKNIFQIFLCLYFEKYFHVFISHKIFYRKIDQCRIFYSQLSKLVYLLENIFNTWSFIKYFTNSNLFIISSNYFNNHHHHHLLFHHHDNHLTNISCTIIIIMSLLSSSSTTTSNTTAIAMSRPPSHHRHLHHLLHQCCHAIITISPPLWPSPSPSPSYHHHHNHEKDIYM